MGQSVHLDDRCELKRFDSEKVERVRRAFQTMDIEMASHLFKTISDPNRLKVVYALAKEKEVCVCDIAEILGSTLATASHHLRLLRNMGFAKQRKVGKRVFYSLKNDQLQQLIDVVFTSQKVVR